MNKKFALVTGASRGLGRAFAYELSKRHINTILVSLPGEGLNALCSELKLKYNTESVCFETDLTVKGNILKLAKWVDENFQVSMLINNAGTGGTRLFTQVDTEYLDRIIQLNVTATSLLTHRILPNLIRQPESYILNVASMSAFCPVCYKTVYPASKVFVRYFSLGLNRELAGTNVFVSTVYPGAMKTNKSVNERIGRHGVLVNMGILSPEKVAEISIRQMLRREKTILLNYKNRVNWLLLKLLPPNISLSILAHIFKSEIESDRGQN